jgi:hypothetical protein
MTLRWLAATLALLAAAQASAALHVVIVEGLAGEAVYATQFATQTAVIREAVANLADEQHVRVLSGTGASQPAVRALFKSLASAARADDRLALYLIGHGSFDGTDYKFNLPGPDLTGTDLKALLSSFPGRDQLVVATGSSSGALQDLLKSTTRVVMTGTRSGAERNATHFGTEFAAALADAAADTDKNGSLSAQEAFDFAVRGVKGFYEREVRLASEHAQLSGERAARFVVARSGAGGAIGAADAVGAAGAEASTGVPVADINQAERERINNALDALRLRKTELPADQYNAKLEALLVDLATLDAGP